LSAGEGYPPFADKGLIAFGKRQDFLVDAGEFRGPFDLFHRRVRFGKGDVFQDRGGKEKMVLGHVAEQAAVGFQGIILDPFPAEQNLPVVPFKIPDQ